jgi:hypothetical protein
MRDNSLRNLWVFWAEVLLTLVLTPAVYNKNSWDKVISFARAEKDVKRAIVPIPARNNFSYRAILTNC